jgi:hypothetical protein
MSVIANNVNMINEHVLAFLEKVCQENEYDSSVFFQEWNSEDNQDTMNKLLSKASKKTKKIKDPNKPKKPRSAYLFFCAYNRQVIKNELGDDAKATEVTTELGVQWNVLKNSTKAADKKKMKLYATEAEEDKSRYEQEMSNYEPPSDEELVEKKKSSRKKKDPNAPKRGKSAYIFFCAEYRPQVKEELGEEAKTTEVTSRLGELWTEMKNDNSVELKKFQKLSEADKKRYQKEMEAYKSDEETSEVDELSDEEIQVKKAPVVKKKSTKKSSTKKSSTKKSSTKKSSTKKLNGYTFYCREKRASFNEDNPDLTAQEITKEIGKTWKALSADEKQEWKDAATAENEE